MLLQFHSLQLLSITQNENLKKEKEKKEIELDIKNLDNIKFIWTALNRQLS